jgi:hypothetical protein
LREARKARPPRDPHNAWLISPRHGEKRSQEDRQRQTDKKAKK